ncbi:MAG: PQQ-binding-like beta-propeller repeat protein [Planctomycetaceae bacterium]
MIIAGLLITTAAPLVTAGDWPQILGPARDGRAAADERLAESWPSSGPSVAWRKPVGAGYAGLAVVGGRAILFHRVGSREVVECLDTGSGRTLWSDGHETTFRPQVGSGDGPLCTPVVASGRVVTYGAQGVLSTHYLDDGQLVWRRDTHREFSAPEGYFGAGSTPLVVGDRVVVNVGGRTGGVVAFALETGEILWTATDEQASYSAPIEVAVNGRPHVLAVTRYRCLLIDADGGAVRWDFPFGMRGPTVNGASPILFRTASADDRPRLLVTSSYGIGSIAAAFDGSGVERLWEGTEALASQYATPVVLDRHAFCIDGRDDLPPASLTCVDLVTGRATWTESDFGYGTLVAAGDLLIATKTDGEIVLLRANPERFDRLGKARPIRGTLRALPALSAGMLYVRDDESLVCLDVGRDRRDP